MSYLFINSQKVDYNLTWILAKNLITNENQTRNRSDVGSIAQVNQIANNLQPELLEQSFELSTGAPVIDNNNNIISGHGRIEAIKSAYYDYNLSHKYQDYQDYIISKFKLPIICNKPTESSLDCYILCRVISTEHNTVDNIHAANSTTLSYTPYELAKINSKRLKSTVDHFVTSLPLLEQSQYLTDGVLNLKAYDDFLSAKIIAALPNCTILADFINYPNPDFKNVITAILNNIDLVLDIQQNNTPLFNQFSLALDKFLQIKQNNGNIEDFLLQLDMFDSELNGADFSSCLAALWNNTRSAKLLTAELAAILNKNANLSLFDELPQVDNSLSTLEISNVDNSNIKSELIILPTPSPSKIIPRSWQSNTIESVNNAINYGKNRILISAATGAGKAMLLMFIIQKMLQCNKRVLLLVDRIKLVKQLCDDASKFGFSYNLIQGINKLINHDNLLTIASIQSYFSQDYGLEFDYIIQDEAHSQYTQLTKLLTTFSGVAIGCTATPITKGLKRIYPHLIESITHNQLINDNVLVPLSVKELKPIDMTTARILAGEWLSEDIVERCQVGFDDWIIESILSYTSSRSIAFCANIEHCEQLRDRLAGQINAAVYTSMQNDAEREQILSDYDNHKIDMLITVATLSKGFNRPDITTIIDLRPLRESITEYIQIIGRGTRVFKGKTECVVLDFTGNWNRFGEDVVKMQSKGVRSAFESTYTDTDRIMLTNGVNERTAFKIEYLQERGNLDKIMKLKTNDKTILDLQRIATKHVIQGRVPPPLSLKLGVFDKIKQFFKGIL